MATFYGTTASNATTGSTTCWLTWTGNYVDCSNSSITISDAGAVTADCWVRWTADSGTSASEPVRLAAQVVADWQAALEQQARERAEHERRRVDAVNNSEALLCSLLSDEQWAHLRTDRYFDVIARGSKRRYRIFRGSHGNIYLLNERGDLVTKYCGQPTGVPPADILIAQKLQIEFAEEEFLKHANATILRRAA